MGLTLLLGSVLAMSGIASPHSTEASTVFHDRLARPVMPLVLQTLEQSVQAERDGQSLKALALTLSAVNLDPIRIRLDDTAAELQTPLSEAVSVWNTALGEPAFLQVRSTAEADFVVVFLGEAEYPGHAGRAEIQFRYRISAAGMETERKGTIRVARSVHGAPLSEREKVTVLLHEMGHVLGLDDVSDRGALMAPLNRQNPARGPTPEEVATVLELRQYAGQRAHQLQASGR